MMIYNLTTNAQNLYFGYLDNANWASASGTGIGNEGGVHCNTVALAPGASFQCDMVYAVTGYSGGSFQYGWVTDTVASTYVGTILGTTGSAADCFMHQSWSLPNVFLDGFWWGLSYLVIWVVIRMAKAGAFKYWGHQSD